jgi:hypothetical protein
MPDTLPAYLDHFGVERRDPWVDVVFVQGFDPHDDPELAALLSADQYDVDAIADYLAQWDFGNETDGAHTTDQNPRTADRFARVYDVTLAEGHDYVLTMNDALGTLSLSRRPLDWAPGEFAS